MPISPWHESVHLDSPNGALTASMVSAHEVAMSAPTRGQLEISNGVSVDDCNPSIAWSDDSRFLAAPQWTDELDQRLLIISVADGQMRYAPGKYTVLELHSFADGVVRGVLSPAHDPAVLTVNVSRIEWT